MITTPSHLFAPKPRPTLLTTGLTPHQNILSVSRVRLKIKRQAKGGRNDNDRHARRVSVRQRATNLPHLRQHRLRAAGWGVRGALPHQRQALLRAFRPARPWGYVLIARWVCVPSRGRALLARGGAPARALDERGSRHGGIFCLSVR